MDRLSPSLSSSNNDKKMCLQRKKKQIEKTQWRSHVLDEEKVGEGRKRKKKKKEWRRKKKTKKKKDHWITYSALHLFLSFISDWVCFSHWNWQAKIRRTFISHNVSLCHTTVTWSCLKSTHTCWFPYYDLIMSEINICMRFPTMLPSSLPLWHKDVSNQRM